MKLIKYAIAGIAMAALVPVAMAQGQGKGQGQAQGNAPRFEVDASWPKPLPNNWVVGQVGGIAVDRNDNIWIIQRSRSLTNDEAYATDAVEDSDPPVDELGFPRPFGPISDCCLPAPAVMQFDPQGNLLQAWGGPADPGFVGPGGRCDPDAGCTWPAGEHGIYVDHNDNVYIAGNGTGTGLIGGRPALWAATHGPDSHVLKFSKDGTFLLQIGFAGFLGPDSNDIDGGINGTPQVFRPADMEVDPATNELYIADGYGNRRVVVVDAETGLYKRHWGAYGQNPVDDTPTGNYAIDRDEGNPLPQFRNPVHCVRIADDGLVYVCDRVNNRIQVFKKDEVGEPCENAGLEEGVCGFVTETFIRADTLGAGSVWDLDTSSDKRQSCLYNPDGTNQVVDTLNRLTLDVVATFGQGGRNAGDFHWVHNLATDSKGNIYTAEVDTGKRAQKFERFGPTSCRPF